MSSSTAIFLGGVHAVILALFHILFWPLFRWKSELPKLHFSNRAILQIANIQLIAFFLLVAVLCFGYADELASSRLGQALLAGISAWWVIRFVQQFIFLRVNDRRVHLLSAILLLGSIFFAWPLID